MLEESQTAQALAPHVGLIEQQQKAAQQKALQKQVQQQQQATAQAQAQADAEIDASLGQPMVDAVVQRAVLTQLSELVTAAKPPAATKEEPKKKDNAKKKDKKDKKNKEILSTWAETFIAAVQALESNTHDASAKAQKLLDAALASAGKPGAPRDALAITLRGIGFSSAATALLDEAAAAYARALAESKKRAPDSMMLLGCWRDMAIIRRERGEHTEAEVCWNEAAVALQQMQTAAGRAIKGGPTSATLLSNMAARVELQLARADCLRDQRRYEEAEALIRGAGLARAEPW